MAAPEYLIKLKFGTEVDQAAFREIQSAYESLSKKSKQTFAKQYGSTLDEMDKLFKKQHANSLREYERATIKTEETITSKRISELRKYINKRNEQMKRMPGYTAGALGAGALAIANAGIGASFSLTEYDKNTLTRSLNMGTAGLSTGAMVGGVPGAVVGAAIGTTVGFIMSEFENSANKIQKSATLFNDAVSKYKQALSVTEPLDTEMKAAGFTDEGKYLTFRNALMSAGIASDAWIPNIMRMIGSQKGLGDLGAKLLASSPDEAIQALFEMYQKSGLSAREFVMGSREKGGLNLGRQGLNLIKIFEEGGLNELISQELRTAIRVGALRPGETSATALTSPLRATEKIRKESESMERWQAVAENRALENINLNESIMKERARSFDRSVQLMNEHNLLVEGVNELYKSYAKELKQIFEEITLRTGKKGTDGRTPMQVAMGRSPFIPQDFRNKLDNANNAINTTRQENRDFPLIMF